MARRYEAIEMLAHRAVISQQVIDEERDQKQVKQRGCDVDQAEESSLQPLTGHTENALKEVGFAGLFELRLQKLVSRRADLLYLMQQFLYARLISHEVARLIVGFYQLPPEPGQYEDQNQGQRYRRAAEGQQNRGRARPSSPFEPRDERRQQIGQRQRAERRNQDDAGADDNRHAEDQNE